MVVDFKTICTTLFSALTLGALLTAPALADTVTRESDIVGLRLGQRVLVEDASCPAGQIKEIAGVRLTATGVERTRKCIERKGAPRR